MQTLDKKNEFLNNAMIVDRTWHHALVLVSLQSFKLCANKQEVVSLSKFYASPIFRHGSCATAHVPLPHRIDEWMGFNGGIGFKGHRGKEKKQTSHR